MHKKPSHRRIQSENNINIDFDEDFAGKIIQTSPHGERRPSHREIVAINANAQLKYLKKTLKKERQNNINAIIKKKSMEIGKYEGSPELINDFSETESDKERKKNFLKSGFTWAEVQTVDGTNIKSMISIEENDVEDKNKVIMHEMIKLKSKKKNVDKKMRQDGIFAANELKKIAHVKYFNFIEKFFERCYSELI